MLCVDISPQKCEVGKKFMLFGDDTHVHCAYAYIPNQIHAREKMLDLGEGFLA